MVGFAVVASSIAVASRDCFPFHCELQERVGTIASSL